MLIVEHLKSPKKKKVIHILHNDIFFQSFFVHSFVLLCLYIIGNMPKSCLGKFFLKIPYVAWAFPYIFFFSQQFMIFCWTKISSFTQCLPSGSLMFITKNTPKRILDIKQNKTLFSGSRFLEVRLCKTLGTHHQLTWENWSNPQQGREDGGGRKEAGRGTSREMKVTQEKRALLGAHAEGRQASSSFL